MNTTEKISKKIDKLASQNESDKASMRAKLEKAEADKAEGQKALDAAIEQNDDAAYHKAKEKIRFASDTIEMCSNKLAALDSSVCARAEYEEISSAIDNASIEAEQAAAKKAASLLMELWKVVEELDKTIDDNNALLARWTSLASNDASPIRYFNKNTSEVLYLGTALRRRKMAKPDYYHFVKG